MKKLLGWLAAAALAASQVPSLAPYQSLLIMISAALQGSAHQAPPTPAQLQK